MMETLRNNLVKLDLHGETKDIARVLCEEFILDNYELAIENLVIVHGQGEGILKKEVHNVLKKNRMVKEFNLDSSNTGQTFVKLDILQKNCYNMQHKNEGGIL